MVKPLPHGHTSSQAPMVPGGLLTADQVRHWRDTGCLVVHGIVPDQLVFKAMQQATSAFVDIDRAAKLVRAVGASPASFPHVLFKENMAGSPADAMSGANELALHPSLLDISLQLLHPRAQEFDIRLASSNLLPIFDGGHTSPDGPPGCSSEMFHLAAPDECSPEAVVAYVFLGGSAQVKCKCLAKGSRVAELAFDCSSPSTILLLRLECQHALASSVPVQVCQRLVYRIAEAEWVRVDAYIRHIAGISFIPGLSPKQLCALGFPPPGHPYWTMASLSQVSGRYPGINLALFRDAMRRGQGAARGEPLPILPTPAPPRGTVETDRTRTWMEPQRLVDPEAVAHLRGSLPLNETQVAHWREHGWVFVDGIWPSDLMEEGSCAAEKMWPHTRAPYEEAFKLAGFPFADDSLNQITLHPRLLGAVGQLLGCPANEVRLTQSLLLGKTGPKQTPKAWPGNQWIHLDFGNNTLLTPARSTGQWKDVEEVQGILYYSDSDEVGGGTAFVDGLRHTHDNRTGERPKAAGKPGALYSVERRAKYRKGSILLYQLGFWHRGTPVNVGQTRRVHHLCFRLADAEWVGGSSEVGAPTSKTLQAFSLSADNNFDLAGFLGRLSPDQRTVLGFPPVGSAYWNSQTLQAVRKRYAGAIDMAPYEGRSNKSQLAVRSKL